MTSKRTTSTKPGYLGLAAFLLAPIVLGARGCDVAVIGSECGGLTGEDCGSGQFCDFALDAACGAADQTGRCQEIPEVCTRIFAPVCGCDDRTYGNACEANAAGVSVASDGECETSGNDACGGLLGLSCADDEFCNFAPDAFCGAADQTGTCEPRPEVCLEIFSPVCGCDDRTYGNACEANRAGVSVVSDGECGGGGGGGGGGTDCGGLLGLSCADGEYCNFPPEAFCGAADQTGTCEPLAEFCTLQFDPVCGCDDRTYGNACEAAQRGVSVAREGECQSAGGQSCGGDLPGGSQTCGAGEFCNFTLDAICGFADATGTCQPTPEACILIFDPVCGCDGRTYGNACEASSFGVSVASEGECEGDAGNPCGGLLGLPCAEGEFCDFAPEALCGAADATGTCRETPEFCTEQFDPVCGCDGETHGNACAANAAGISVVSEGECQ